MKNPIYLTFIIIFALAIALYFFADPKEEIAPEIAGIARKENEENQDLLLPDLQVEKLSDAYIEVSPDRKRVLRFPGEFINIGDGALELAGSLDEKTKTTSAIQRIYKKDGTKDERYVGNFVYHDTHNHFPT